MEILTPFGDHCVLLHMVGFVDDSTTITGGNKTDTVQDLLKKMQEDAQLWCDLLWCSGGNLELSKCGFHCIHYTFQDDGLPVMKRSAGEDLTVTTPTGEEVKIKGKNIYTPRKNLGHYKAPAGIYRAQFEAILEKATMLNEAIDRSGATRKETRMFYDTVWRQAIEYTLAQSFNIVAFSSIASNCALYIPAGAL